jgi:hypothetical protein
MWGKNYFLHIFDSEVDYKHNSWRQMTSGKHELTWKKRIISVNSLNLEGRLWIFNEKIDTSLLLE